MNEGNSPFHPDHCDPRMTYIRYESPSPKEGRKQSKKQIQNLFLGNARRLLGIVKSKNAGNR
jgi:hypothetical protein